MRRGHQNNGSLCRTGLFTVLTHFKYDKYQYSSFEFMVMDPPVSSKKERKWARQLKSYQFWGKTNAKNGLLNTVFPRPEGRVSCSWSSPPEFLQKSCEKWLIWTKRSFTIIWMPLEKADVKCHILCCYLTGLKEEWNLCQSRYLFFLLWRCTFQCEGFSQKDTFLEQDNDMKRRMLWRSLSPF